MSPSSLLKLCFINGPAIVPIRKRTAEVFDKSRTAIRIAAIRIALPEGIQYIQPQRTNNIPERFFRGIKRWGRKKSGMSSLSKLLRTTLADTPLVQNLKGVKA